MSSTYLLEIGTEELPANHIPEAQRRLTALFTTELENERLSFDKIETFATPRRLTVKVSGLPLVQETIEKKGKYLHNHISNSNYLNKTY